MVALKFSISILTVTLSGFFLLAILFKDLKRYSLLELIAMSFGIGACVITLGMFFLSLLEIKFSVFSFLFFQVMLYLFGSYRILKKGNPISINFRKPKLSVLDIVLIALIIFNIAYVLLVTPSLPFLEADWDSWSHWGYKAKFFLLNRGIGAQLFLP
jgi:hypothetical protein